MEKITNYKLQKKSPQKSLNSSLIKLQQPASFQLEILVQTFLFIGSGLSRII